MIAASGWMADGELKNIIIDTGCNQKCNLYYVLVPKIRHIANSTYLMASENMITTNTHLTLRAIKLKLL